MLDEIAAVRRFNRVVTERVGALHDGYLGRARPLGASRVLWEVGRGTSDLRALRRQLDLDSGYLSRLLRSLEAEGLVTVEPAAHDGRVRVVRLTAEGHQESEVLDRSSDTLAESMLAPLDQDQRRRLVEAMATVGRLLTAGLVETTVEDPTNEDAQFCIAQYFAELDERFDAGFDPAMSISAGVDELTEPAGLLLVARLRGEAIGCGALKFHDDEPAEIKRMWVSPSARGLGAGSPHAAGARTPRRRASRHHREAGDESIPRRSDQPLPIRRLPGGPSLQRRAVRAPLVREAALIVRCRRRCGGKRRSEL